VVGREIEEEGVNLVGDPLIDPVLNVFIVAFVMYVTAILGQKIGM
jgi:hypothetical protein